MAYLPNTWVDQNVQRPKTYNFTQNDDGSTTLIDAFGDVTELGTPVNADYMNHIENGIAGCAIRKYSTTETFIKGEWVQADLDGVQGLYESLTNSNLGNPLSDETKWKKVDLGGGSGTGGGFSLFDVVEKDHILSFEESMGFGLLGTYVYKEPVAGSRYGYPDFYNECVAQKSTEGNTLLALKNNVEIVGSPVVNNGVLSGFSTSSYATTLTFPTDEDFDFQFKLKTGADISGEQEIFACPTASGPSQYYFCLVNLESNNLNVIFNGGLGVWQYPFGTPAQPETDYIVKVVYSKTNNTLHVTMSLANGTVLLDDTKQVDELYDIKEAVIGTGKDNAVTIFNPFKGSVDLKECYIESNGQRIWSGASIATKNPNGHIFYDIADKATVDEIFSQRGEAWFYGVDTENERIFLPRGTRSQYTVNTDETGDYVEAGLPNIKSSRGLGYSDDNPTSDVPPFVYVGSFGNVGGGSSIEKAYSFDASTANPIYGKSDTVQPYATKKLLYIVVGNVKVQSAASDVVDVTTTENDTVPLFTGQYFDFKPNNVSWLKANETKASGGIYTSCYNKLVQALTPDNNIWNIKVIDVAHMVSGTDYSLYWKVDQDSMSFTCPIRTKDRVLAKSYVDGTNWYNWYSDGWIEQGGTATNCTNNTTVSFLKSFSTTNYFVTTQQENDQNALTTDGINRIRAKQTNQFTFSDANGDSKKTNTWYACGYGAIPQPSEYDENINLYFKVANAVENLDLLDAGEVLEVLATKVDKTEIDSFINDNALNITNTGVPDNAKRYNISAGYTAPTSGWVFLRNLEESRCHIIIDGIDYDYANDWGDGGSENSIIWKVGKGQVISWSGRISAALFIPDKLIGVE